MSECTHSNNDSVTEKKWSVAQSILTEHPATPFPDMNRHFLRRFTVK